ncbi:MAG: ABC transporter permease [Variibacter sp.]
MSIPVVALLYGSFRTSAPGTPGEWTLRNYAGLASEGVTHAIWDTLWIGLVSAALCVAIGTTFALLLHRTDFKYTKLIAETINLAFYFPSFILAMAWIIIGAPGGIWNALVDDTLGLPALRVDIYTGAGIVFVMVLHQIPFVYLTMRGPVMNMDGIYEEAARTSGAKPLAVLRRVALPLLSYSLISELHPHLHHLHRAVRHPRADRHSRPGEHAGAPALSAGALFAGRLRARRRDRHHIEHHHRHRHLGAAAGDQGRSLDDRHRQGRADRADRSRTLEMAGLHPVVRLRVPRPRIAACDPRLYLRAEMVHR